MVLGGVAHAFSDDIAIDLGTANTLVHVVGRGVIIDEPSVVAVATRGGTRDVLAVGLRAKAMQLLQNKELSILAERHLRNLKQEANIEYK